MEELKKLAELIKQKNIIESKISSITNRPALIGHTGEYIASTIFNIKLEDSAVSKNIDGRFQDEPLKNKTVNIKWYGKMESLIDISTSGLPDYYLVLAGPKSPAISSRGSTRPWIISYVYLFRANELIENCKLRGVKVGIATSVPLKFWEDHQIYPVQNNKEYILSDYQMSCLKLFDFG